MKIFFQAEAKNNRASGAIVLMKYYSVMIDTGTIGWTDVIVQISCDKDWSCNLEP